MTVCIFHKSFTARVERFMNSSSKSSRSLVRFEKICVGDDRPNGSFFIFLKKKTRLL